MTAIRAGRLTPLMLVLVSCPRRSMDRTQVSGTCNVGSIPTGGIEKIPTYSWDFFYISEWDGTREGVGKREFPVAEILKPRGFKAKRFAFQPRAPEKTRLLWSGFFWLSRLDLY
jgi:hypothetical protein